MTMRMSLRHMLLLLRQKEACEFSKWALTVDTETVSDLFTILQILPVWRCPIGSNDQELRSLFTISVQTAIFTQEMIRDEACETPAKRPDTAKAYGVRRSKSGEQNPLSNASAPADTVGVLRDRVLLRSCAPQSRPILVIQLQKYRSTTDVAVSETSKPP